MGLQICKSWNMAKPLALDMPLAPDMSLALDTLWLINALPMVLTNDLRSTSLGLLRAKAYQGTC